MEKLVASKCRYSYILGKDKKESTFLPELGTGRAINTL
jgi:hypothetical protein